MNLLKKVRKMLGLSQEEMGKKLGCTRQSIYNKEKGIQDLTLPEKYILEQWRNDDRRKARAREIYANKMHLRENRDRPSHTYLYEPAFTESGKPIFEPHPSLPAGRDGNHGQESNQSPNSGENKQ